MSAGQPKNFLMLEITTSAARSSWSAVRSALVADVLRGSGYLRLQVRGESMLPALWPGDVVGITSCSPEDVRPGEIVLALRDGRFFLHRLVALRRPSGFLLCGDSMPGSDPQFPLEAFLGRLVRDQNANGVFGETWFAAKWSRALGLLLCHFTLARRLALKLHQRRVAAAGEFRHRELAADIPSAELEASLEAL
jgi:signal peptidase I